MSYIKPPESSDDEMTIFRVKDEPAISFVSPLFEYPPKFQKKPLKFEKIEKYPDEYKSISNELENADKKLMEIATKVLFKWDDVPVVFPPSLTGIDSQEPSKNQFFKMGNLFSDRYFEELEELAIDPITGKTKRLNKTQLDSIRKTGSFEVESKTFNGKNHKWVLAKWIQKGTTNIKNSFYKEISKALSLLIITARRRFYYKKFSVLRGFKSWFTGFRNLFDILFGIPEMNVRYYHEDIMDDLKKFMVAELLVDDESQESLEAFAKKIKMALSDPKYAENTWSVPYHYKTRDNLAINLSLYAPDIKYTSIVQEILNLDENEKAILDRLKMETIDLFKNENLDSNIISERTEKILLKEYLKIVYKKLLNNSELKAISPEIGQLLVERFKTFFIMKQVLDEISQEMDSHIQSFGDKLKKKYPVRSMITTWFNDAIDAEKEKFIANNIYEAHLRSIKKCKDENLLQSAYFIEREMQFMKEQRDQLTAKYEKIKEPVNTYRFHRRIWFPKNYIIKNVKGHNETPFYVAEKSIVYKNTTRYPFWRWKNFFMRTGINFLNFFYLFGIVIPFCSPVSFRALVWPKPFCPGKDVDQNTGALVSLRQNVLSYVSRLRALWEHVRKSVVKFENTPDKGLIGKGLQRIFNRFWNYIIKGFFGTIGLTIINPAICMTCSIASLGLCLTTPLWVPVFSIFQHLGFIFIFDWDYPHNGTLKKFFRFFRIFGWNFFICGILQPISALATSLILCPIGSAAICTFSITTMIFRKMWDTFIFYGILKRQSKVPSSDTFVARRVEGPGLAYDHFIQATPEQVLAALEINLERKIIQNYLDNIKSILEQPITDLNKLFVEMFEKYSFSLNLNVGPYKEVEENISHNISKYVKEASRRYELLDKLVNNSDLTRIRLTEKNLKVVIFEAIRMVKKHYLDSILPFSKKDPNLLFKEKSLKSEDWNGIAEIELEELFGNGFLCPLENTDFYFSLKIDHLNLQKYTEMITSSELRDDLDKFYVSYNPKSERLSITNPQYDISIFDDVGNQNFSYNFFGKNSNETLSIPTRMPWTIHCIAAIIYNLKHNQDQIKYDYLYDISRAVTRSGETSKI